LRDLKCRLIAGFGCPPRRCAVCGLKLRDPEELEVVDLETETTAEEEWEPSDDGEYYDE
jgi:hypothetical protein